MWIAYMLTQGDETIVHSETGERRQLTMPLPKTGRLGQR